MWQYRCDDCAHHSTWMPRADAEEARDWHHRTHHSGRASRRDGFVSDAQRISPAGFAAFAAVMLGLWLLAQVADLLG